MTPFSAAVMRAEYGQLEVMISPDGKVFFADPSHQEFLIQRAMELHDMTREELMDACPPKYYANFLDWLIPRSGGYIPVWADGIINYPITKGQSEALRRLKAEKLYRGIIPPVGQSERPA